MSRMRCNFWQSLNKFCTWGSEPPLIFENLRWFWTASYTHNKKQSVDFIIFSPYIELFRAIFIFHANSYNNALTQCHVDGAQRALATCAFCPSSLFVLALTMSHCCSRLSLWTVLRVVHDIVWFHSGKSSEFKSSSYDCSSSSTLPSSLLIFSAEYTIGMVWGLATLKHYGNKVVPLMFL